MVEGDLFDKLAFIGSQIRKNTVPFGGIQVCFLICRSLILDKYDLLH